MQTLSYNQIQDRNCGFDISVTPTLTSLILYIYSFFHALSEMQIITI